MRPLRGVLVASALALAFGATTAEARYNGNLNLFVGRKWMTNSQWHPVEEQPAIGLSLAFGEERISVHFAVDAYFAKQEDGNPNPAVDSRVRGQSSEFAVGVRKLWGQGATRPFLGGGATIITISQDFDGPSGPVSFDDRAYGAWIEAGIFWRLAGHLNLGLQARYSKADAKLGPVFDPVDVDAGGFQAGLLIGYGW
jgi:hypothetical protein